MALPPNFKPGVGRLATDRYDFQAHLDGIDPPNKTGFRHSSDQIDVVPDPNLGSPSNLEEALAGISTFVSSQLAKGDGFITVGEGYDSYANADTLSGILFDETTPSLDSLLNPIFQAIMDNGIGTGLEINPLPEQYKRIERGGIVLIRSGTYIVRHPIIVPPGIVIMGEGFGTKIINATSLDLSTADPALAIPATPAPVFTVVADGYRGVNDTAISGPNSLPTDYRLFMFGRKSILSNMVVSDNFVDYPVVGSTNYKLAQNKTGDTPLIQQQQGSNLLVDNVYLMGRVQYNTFPTVLTATRFAIQLDGYSGNQNGTFLKVNNCFIDGFSIPVDFKTTGGSNDFLEVTGNRIKAYGYLDGNASGTTNPESNTFIRMNDNNALITNNHLYGNSDSVSSVLYLNAVLGTSVNVQAKAKILMSGNTVTIDRAKNTPNSIFRYLKVNGSVSNYSSKITSSFYGNDFQSTVGFEVFKDNSASLFNITDTVINLNLDSNFSGAVNLNGQLTNTGVKSISPTDSPYSVAVTDYTILVTSSGTVTVTLPSAVTYSGRFLTIKDASGTAGTNLITIACSLGQTIDGASNKVISTNYGVFRLISNGTNWSVI